jgi:hypothetical protein
VDNGDDTWTLTSKEGTESTYEVMGYTGTKKFRYGLSSVEDVHGNRVSYTWSCASATEPCYPATVAYNGAVVTFHRETRPDPVTSPASIEQTERLSTAEVTLSGAMVRAYRLSYSVSAETGRSLLESVAMYGRPRYPP